MESAATRLLATVASGVFGLLIGSFLNVVVYRLPRAMSIARPPSHCPACDAQLSALDNIPVLSWLALRGRCRHCGTPISPRYPVIELVTGVLFVGLALALPSVKPIASLAGVVATTIAVAAIDVDNLRVPPVLGWFAAASAASLLAVSTAGHVPGRLGWAGIGAGTAVAAWLLHWALDRAGPTSRCAWRGVGRPGGSPSGAGWPSGSRWPSLHSRAPYGASPRRAVSSRSLPSCRWRRSSPVRSRPGRATIAR